MITSSDKTPPAEKASLKDRLRHAFAVGSEYDEKLEDDEESLLRDIALNIHRRRLAPVAIPLLLFNKPLNVVGANMVQMGEVLFTMGPVEGFLRRFLGENYTHELLVRTLEKRCSIERLVEFLEAHIEERSGEDSV
jgi:hypothetical protein